MGVVYSSFLSSSSQKSSWDSLNLEIASSRKFKWLRERVSGSSPHTLLLNQIKSFVLTDEVVVKTLTKTLKRQVSSTKHSLTLPPSLLPPFPPLLPSLLAGLKQAMFHVLHVSCIACTRKVITVVGTHLVPCLLICCIYMYSR